MTSALLIVMNLSVPEDRRVWLQAETLRDAGWDVDVVCPALHSHAVGCVDLDGIRVTYYRAFDAKTSAGLVAEVGWDVVNVIKQYLQRGRTADLVQVANPLDVLAPVLRAARRLGSATIYDQHDVVPELALLRPVLRRAVSAFIAMERSTLHASTTVITSSQEQAHRLHRLYGIEAAVIRTAGFDMTNETCRRVPHRGPITMGYLGVIGVQDAVEDAVLAFQAACSQYPETRLLIGGDGPAAGSVRALIRSLALEDRVEMVGWLSSRQVEEFLSRLDLMLVPDRPSLFNDLCAMNKVTHALSVGLPVVMRPLTENVNVAGGHAIVATGPNLAEFQEAISYAVTLTPEERHELGSSGRDHYRIEHSWQEHSKRYLAYAEEAVTTAADRFRRRT